MASLTGTKSRRQGRGDTLYLRVGGMTCDRCVRTVTSALLSLSGVEEVSIHDGDLPAENAHQQNQRAEVNHRRGDQG